MAKNVLIDWQRDGLIVATGTHRGTKVSLEQINLQAIGGESKNSNAVEAVRQAVAALGLGKSDATVVVSRELVEVRTVSIPRIDANELPDVIRFQAQRQLANMGETWPLDFILLPNEPGQEMQTALVGVISPAHLAEIETACSNAGLTLAHVALRPIEIARFTSTAGLLPATGNVLLVCMTNKNADLMILSNGRVIQVRATKLPSDTALMASTINGEIRRSLMAASNQIGNQPLSAAVVISEASLADAIVAAVSEASGASVSHVDAATVLPKSSDQQELSQTVGHRIAALAGALALPSATKQTTIDFKNPKRRPPKQSNTRTYILAAAAAAVLVLGGGYWWYATNRDLDQQLTLLLDDNKMKEERIPAAQKNMKDVELIRRFLDSSPNWLDELTYISHNIPPADSVRIYGTELTATDRGGQIRIEKVLAESDEVITEFEESLRVDGKHIVEGAARIERSVPADNYRWEIQETISLMDRGWKLIDELKLTENASSTDESDGSDEKQQPGKAEEADESPSPQPDGQGPQSLDDKVVVGS
ncbi:MAG: hypothetical protein KDB22_04980 [Planctomycetales bacterium]|nr:hypothetical protein [Planctomycetales bacterium]